MSRRPRRRRLTLSNSSAIPTRQPIVRPIVSVVHRQAQAETPGSPHRRRRRRRRAPPQMMMRHEGAGAHPQIEQRRRVRRRVREARPQAGAVLARCRPRQTAVTSDDLRSSRCCCWCRLLDHAVVGRTSCCRRLKSRPVGRRRVAVVVIGSSPPAGHAPGTMTVSPSADAEARLAADDGPHEGAAATLRASNTCVGVVSPSSAFSRPVQQPHECDDPPPAASPLRAARPPAGRTGVAVVGLRRRRGS